LEVGTQIGCLFFILKFSEISLFSKEKYDSFIKMKFRLHKR
jgi:hypothetical protein